MSNHDPIHLVARAMTDAPPDPALVDRVRARLDAAPRSRRSPHLRWMVPTAAAAVLVVVIAVMMRPAPHVSPTGGPESPTIPASSTTATLAAALQGPDASEGPKILEGADASEGPDFSPARSRATRAARTTAPTEAELAWLARSVQPLAAIPAMTIDPLVVESTQPQPLVLPPLTITPLTIPPLNGDPNGGRHD
jgi:hypothetical protein